MLKKLLLTTALSGLMLSSAVAQSSSPSGSTPSSTTPPAASSSSSMSGSASTVSSQKPDQLLASKVDGADVYGANDEKIGDISDILFSKDGKVEAYILSVGGFLGVGAKEVALAPSSIQFSQDKDAWKLKVSMSKEQLAQAPNFERYKEPRTTTGASSAGSGASSAGSGAMAPRNNAPAGGSAPANRP